MSNVLSPSIICVNACPPTATWMAVSTSLTSDVPGLHFSRSTVNSRLGCPLIRKMPTFRTP